MRPNTQYTHSLPESVFRISSCSTLNPGSGTVPREACSLSQALSTIGLGQIPRRCEFCPFSTAGLGHSPPECQVSTVWVGRLIHQPANQKVQVGAKVCAPRRLIQTSILLLLFVCINGGNVSPADEQPGLRGLFRLQTRNRTDPVPRIKCWTVIQGWNGGLV